MSIILFRGENESLIGQWDPGDAEYLELVFQNESTQLYEVVMP